MSNTTQATLWKAIQRDARAAKLSDGEFLSRNPARYAAYRDARPDKPTNSRNDKSAANRDVEAAVAEKVAGGMTRGEAYAAVLGGNSGNPDLYSRYKGERPAPNPQRANGGADSQPATGPLSVDEIIALQRQAKALGYDLSIADIEDSGWVATRALMAGIAEEASDMAGDDDDDAAGENYGEIVSFTDVPAYYSLHNEGSGRR